MEFEKQLALLQQQVGDEVKEQHRLQAIVDQASHQRSVYEGRLLELEGRSSSGSETVIELNRQLAHANVQATQLQNELATVKEQRDAAEMELTSAEAAKVQAEHALDTAQFSLEQASAGRQGLEDDFTLLEQKVSPDAMALTMTT